LSCSRDRSRRGIAHGAVVCLLRGVCFLNRKRRNFFFALTSTPQNLHIIDYSLSQTTLEQVFLSFADKQKNSDIGAALGNSAGAAPPPGYAAPPPGYGAPPPGYGAPPPGYAAPPPGYGAPPPGYGAAPRV
jgi:hypothetical protein